MGGECCPPLLDLDDVVRSPSVSCCRRTEEGADDEHPSGGDGEGEGEEASPGLSSGRRVVVVAAAVEARDSWEGPRLIWLLLLLLLLLPSRCNRAAARARRRRSFSSCLWWAQGIFPVMFMRTRARA